MSSLNDTATGSVSVTGEDSHSCAMLPVADRKGIGRAYLKVYEALLNPDQDEDRHANDPFSLNKRAEFRAFQHFKLFCEETKRILTNGGCLESQSDGRVCFATRESGLTWDLASIVEAVEATATQGASKEEQLAVVALKAYQSIVSKGQDEDRSHEREGHTLTFEEIFDSLQDLPGLHATAKGRYKAFKIWKAMLERDEIPIPLLVSTDENEQ